MSETTGLCSVCSRPWQKCRIDDYDGRIYNKYATRQELYPQKKGDTHRTIKVCHECASLCVRCNIKAQRLCCVTPLCGDCEDNLDEAGIIKCLDCRTRKVPRSRFEEFGYCDDCLSKRCVKCGIACRKCSLKLGRDGEGIVIDDLCTFCNLYYSEKIYFCKKCSH